MSKYINEDGFWMPDDITLFISLLTFPEIIQAYECVLDIGKGKELPKDLNRAVKLVVLHIVSYNKWVYEMKQREESEVLDG